MLIVAGADKSLKNKDPPEKGGPKTAQELADNQLKTMRQAAESRARGRDGAQRAPSQSEEAQGADKDTAKPKKDAADDDRLVKACKAWEDCIRSLGMSPEEIRAEDWKEAQEYDSVEVSKVAATRQWML